MVTVWWRPAKEVLMDCFVKYPISLFFYIPFIKVWVNVFPIEYTLIVWWVAEIVDFVSGFAEFGHNFWIVYISSAACYIYLCHSSVVFFVRRYSFYIISHSHRLSPSSGWSLSKAASNLSLNSPLVSLICSNCFSLLIYMLLCLFILDHSNVIFPVYWFQVPECTSPHRKLLHRQQTGSRLPPLTRRQTRTSRNHHQRHRKVCAHLGIRLVPVRVYLVSSYWYIRTNIPT